MARTVLLSLDDIVLAAGVEPLLHDAGFEADIVADQQGLSARSQSADVVAVVVQEQYLDGSSGEDLLSQVAQMHGSVVPAVMVCQQTMTEEQRAPLIKKWGVRAFLNSSTSDEAVLQAVQVAASDDNKPSKDTGDNPFSVVITLSEPEDSLDLLELQDEIIDLVPDSEVILVAADPHQEVTRNVVNPLLETNPPNTEKDLSKIVNEVLEDEIAEGFDDPADSSGETQIDARAEDFVRPIPNQAAMEVIALDARDLLEDEEDMAKLEEMQAELSRERAARKESEQLCAKVRETHQQTRLELEQQGHLVKEKIEAERKARERVQKLEAALKESRAAAKELESERAARAKFEAELKQLQQQKAQLDKELETLHGQSKSKDELPTPASEIFAEDTQPLGDEGRFEVVPYAVLLGRLRRHRFSGVLAISAGSVTREIFVVEGLPVAYASAAPGERLGRILVEQQHITEEQYLKATSRMVERGVKLTDALLELGYIDSEHLAEQQRVLTRDHIVSGFSLSEGRFTLRAGEVIPPGTAQFEFTPGEIFSTGYRQYASEGEVTALFESLRQLYLCVTPDLDAHRSQLGLEAPDERLLHLFGQAYSLEEAVASSGIDEDRAARLLGAIKGLGLIKAWNPGAGKFEERVHRMQLEHQAATLKLREELQAREDRLVDTFERALAKIEQGQGAGASLSSASAKPEKSRKDSFSQIDKMSTSATQEASPSLTNDARTEPSFDASELRKKLNSPSAKVDERGNFDAPPGVRSVSLNEPAESGGRSFDKGLLGSGGKEKNISAEQATTKTLTEGTPVKEPKLSPADLKFREGMNKAAQGQLDEAELALREAVRLDPQKPSFLAALARVLLSNPKYDRGGTLPVVRSLLDRAQTLAPDDDEVRSLLARVSSEQAQLEA